jgi:hypothetical protein
MRQFSYSEQQLLAPSVQTAARFLKAGLSLGVGGIELAQSSWYLNFKNIREPNEFPGEIVTLPGRVNPYFLTASSSTPV